jgi:abequosyltransferase
MLMLSICIPTYNRAIMLAELLDSIIAQELEDEIEVVVSDDASRDDTVAVVESYNDRIKNYKFISQPKNLGMMPNFLAVAAAASGEYIWLMGDDDCLEIGGARRVLDALRRWPNVVGLSVGAIDYDATMTTPIGAREMPPTSVVQGVGAVFSGMIETLGYASSIIIRRVLWNAHVNDPRVREANHYYVHVVILGGAIGMDGKWGVVEEPCVRYRTANDQLKAAFGWLERLSIDVRGYNAIADALFKNDPLVHSAMRRRILDTHILAHILNAKSIVGRTPSVMKASFFLMREYYNFRSYWTRVLPVLIAPNMLIRMARLGYRRFATASGAARARELTRASG